jgi:hypothetical protein
MFQLLRDLAAVGFVLWGIYKGFWVCRKVYKWFRFKYQAWEAEENFVNGLAAQIRYEREHGRSTD